MIISHSGICPVTINDELVRSLISVQFPQWANLPIKPVSESGWDNRAFHLGEQMLVRLPSAEKYALQAAKEHRWLAWLAPHLPLPIPIPIALGEPAFGYPWKWSIYPWLQGAAASSSRIADPVKFSVNLAQFLVSLQRIDSIDGPRPGPHSFYRGGALTTYDSQARRALARLSGQVNVDVAIKLWDAALPTTWQGKPVWVHGDISPGNLLVHEGCLSAIIDFGQLTVGDPACDLVIAWTLFSGKSRAAFCANLALDVDTWTRARAWALWKALIVASGLVETNAVEWREPLRIVDEVLEEFRMNLKYEA